MVGFLQDITSAFVLLIQMKELPVGFVEGFCFRISDWAFHLFQETLRENKERLNRGTEELVYILNCSSLEDSQTLIRQNMMHIG